MPNKPDSRDGTRVIPDSVPCQPRPLVAAIGLALALSVHCAQAGTIAVTTTSDAPDPAECRLRDAIEAANTNGVIAGCAAGDPLGTDVVSLLNVAESLLALSNGEIVISSDVSIEGHGARVDNVGSGRSLFIDSGTVAIDHLTLKFGAPALEVNAGELNLNDSTILNAVAPANKASGIHAVDSDVTVTNSTIWNGELADNSIASFGAVFFNNPSGTLTLQNSTLSGNSSSYEGSALFLGAGYALVQHATLSDNVNQFTFNNQRLGNVHAKGIDSTLALQNSIIANPSGQEKSCQLTNNATVTDLGGNLIEDDLNCGTFQIEGQDPGLAAMSNNGGPTLTRAIGIDSVAVNATPSCINGITTDQRGESRDDGQCDIGAFEFQVPLQTGPNFVVTANDDVNDGECVQPPGHCSLREAVNGANSNLNHSTITAVDSIVQGAGQTITLSNGAISLNTDITIQGNNSPDDRLRISANDASRVFIVNASTTVSLTGLNLADGYHAAFGGAIASLSADLTLTETTISGSSSGNGGGISATGGSLNLFNSVISDNSATTGGAVFLTNSEATAYQSTIDSNIATLHGGGLYAYASDVEITSSMISENTASSTGGGVYFAASDGGTPTLTLTNSTIYGNSASTQVGGLSAVKSEVSLLHVTMDANQAPSIGGARFLNSTVVLDKSILANSDDTDCSSTGSTFSLNDKTLIENFFAGNCGFGSPLLLSEDPRLADVGFRGGPTRSIPLKFGSPAINAGNSAAVGLDFDQRGAPRVQLSAPDLGAYEIGTNWQPGPDLIVTTVDDTNGACEAAPGTCSLREAVKASNSNPDHNIISFSPDLTAPATLELSTNPTFRSEITVQGSGQTLNTSGEAVYAAHPIPGSSTITFANSLPGTITLNGAQINLNSDITIEGGGMTVDADNQSRIFGVNGGFGQTVTISQMHLTGGSTAGGEDGGALRVSSGPVLHLVDSTLTQNYAGRNGGAIAVDQATLSLENCTITGGSAFNKGGGIWGNAAVFFMDDSSISDSGIQFGSGGGISLENGSYLSILSSTFAGNNGDTWGGGIYVRDSDGIIRDSTFSNNMSSGGGGFFGRYSSITISNSTLADNTIGAASGGGLVMTGGTIEIQQVTVSGNSGGLSVPQSTVTLVNSILTGGSAGGDCNANDSIITALGVNLVSENGNCDFGEAVIIEADPMLDALADNGGTTETMLPGALSPVINAGDNAQVPGLLVNDQRGPGFPRIMDLTVDLGAVEGSLPPPDFLFSDGFEEPK